MPITLFLVGSFVGGLDFSTGGKMIVIVHVDSNDLSKRPPTPFQSAPPLPFDILGTSLDVQLSRKILSSRKRRNDQLIVLFCR